MTLMMLPPAPKDVGMLSDVFISALGAIVGGEDNRLKLPRVSSALVVLIDGLGYLNLKENSGHARALSKLLGASGDRSVRCGFPSTTAVSLTSLGTGLPAGAHGILGYQVMDDSGSIRNMLNGWRPQDNPRAWQPNQTVVERARAAGVRASMVAAKEYGGSGFTSVIMGDLDYFGEDDLVARANRANTVASAKQSITYLYFAELDQAAHRHGVNSDEWLATLEAIDQAVARLTGSYGLLITADHGVMDVEPSRQVYVDNIPGFSEAVSYAIGDPRALFCYGDRDKAAKALEASGVTFYSPTFPELIEHGWVADQISLDRVPDFVLIAHGNLAFHDRRTAKPQSLKMIGQHGGISDLEMRVPLIRAGLFS